MTPSRQILKRASSLKLAVVIIIYLCVVIAIGTVIESRLDAHAAKAKVYDSIWMYLGLGALAFSLIAVMADRWPWKKKHAPFILAHIGILTILLGSVLTLKYGLDGSMTIGIGQSQRTLMVAEPEIIIYASFGDRLSKIFEQKFDFYKTDLEKTPLVIPIESGELRFTDFKPYAVPSRQITASSQKSLGTALRFQVTNGQFQQLDWLVQKKPGASAIQDFGPLILRLGGERAGIAKNEVVVDTLDAQHLSYKIFSKDKSEIVRSGQSKEGDAIDLPWMGLKLKVLRYHLHAEERWDVEPRDAPTPLTVSAVKLKYKDQEHWILLNDTLRIFTDSTAYFVSYIYHRLDIGFPITLNKFARENYAGTQKAMAYKSEVNVPEIGDVEITMNEPVKSHGLTFYQASFQEDNFGQPTATVLSVNYDPGRWFKYFGSLIMMFGIILLFYNRRQKVSKKEVDS